MFVYLACLALCCESLRLFTAIVYISGCIWNFFWLLAQNMHTQAPKWTYSHSVHNFWRAKNVASVQILCSVCKYLKMHPIAFCEPNAQISDVQSSYIMLFILIFNFIFSSHQHMSPSWSTILYCIIFLLKHCPPINHMLTTTTNHDSFSYFIHVAKVHLSQCALCA